MQRFDAAAYWNRRLARHWGLHGAGYLSLGTPYNRWLYRVRRRVLERALRECGLDPAGKRVLDVGSGTGFYLTLWRRLGAAPIVGSDFSDVAVERLRQTHPGCEIVPLDIGEAGAARRVPNGPFEIVSAFDVLFHIVDDESFVEALRNLAALCAPGGVLLLSDNFPHQGAVREPHQVSRPLVEVLRLLEGEGFRILRRVPVFWIMNAPVDTQSRWPRVLWRIWMAPVRLVPLLGALYGAALYPLELLLTRTLLESPTTELLICRRRVP